MDIIVIGAGPKAVALAAKSAVLKQLGCEVPNLVFLEKHSVGANWCGDCGYTNGQLLLGTPMEKDVGFPYNSTDWGPLNSRVNAGMSRYSWGHFLIAKGEYGEWIDRGRPQMQHSKWAAYLRWAATEAGLEPVPGVATGIGVNEARDEWTIKYRRSDESEGHLTGQILVITGPGEAPARPRDLGPDLLWFNVVDFWSNIAQIKDREVKGALRLAIIGAGETAASIACAVLDVIRPDSAVSIVCPHGTIFSRGENFNENKWFSDPTGWDALTEDHRWEFINRTDRGVFSQAAQLKINNARNVIALSGRVLETMPDKHGILLRIQYSKKVQRHQFDVVIDGRSGDPLSFAKIFEKSAEDAFKDIVGSVNEESVAIAIGLHLEIAGFNPPLHLPMLSAFQQGPGFPNLSSLGLLSDRILKPYTDVPLSPKTTLSP